MPTQSYRQEAPYCIQVELVLGCNLSCTFCGINGIGYGARKKVMKFMTQQIASRVASQIRDAGWTSRIEFARRGEPSLHPEMESIVRIFRTALPKNSLMATCNGGGFLGQAGPAKRIGDLFDAGLNMLALDDYQHVKIVPKIMEKLDEQWYKDHNVRFHDYPADPEGNPHIRRGARERHLSVVKDISVATTGTHSDINNHGGYGSAARHYPKPCAKPFRELSVDYNGKVPKCCIAWGGEYICGDSAEQDLATIWHGERFNAVRRKLLHGHRDFGTCKGCDHPSMRVGLLPDKYGKHKDAYPVADEQTEAILREMAREGFQEQPTDAYWQNKAALGNLPPSE